MTCSVVVPCQAKHEHDSTNICIVPTVCMACHNPDMKIPAPKSMKGAVQLKSKVKKTFCFVSYVFGRWWAGRLCMWRNKFSGMRHNHLTALPSPCPLSISHALKVSTAPRPFFFPPLNLTFKTYSGFLRDKFYLCLSVICFLWQLMTNLKGILCPLQATAYRLSYGGRP